MIRFPATDLWKEVRVRANKALRRRAVIAYVTDPEPLNLREGDVPITDATHHAISSGQTKAKSLAALFENGVEIHSCPGLHAKVVVVDDIAIASSGNLSGNSIEGRLIEAGVVTDHPTTVSAAINFIERLREETPALSHRQIQSLLAIPVTAGAFIPRRSSTKRKTPMMRRPLVWLGKFLQRE
jgi:phosphatidylserine/phosphatidylglycerophosphate/cardiolipin synthase-like enzyme